MSRAVRKGNTPQINTQLRAQSPNITFKIESIENQVLQPCQDKAELQYLRFEIQQERQKSQQLEMQLQYEINFRVQNEQTLINDITIIRQQNEDLKYRNQELEMKFRENSIQYQNLLKEANDRIVTFSVEIERLHQCNQIKSQEIEYQLQQNEQQQLAQDLISIQKLVEDLRNELLTKQKIIYGLQEQVHQQQQTAREPSSSINKLREQEKNIDQLMSQISVLTQILEDKEQTIQQQVKQIEHYYNELSQMSSFNRQLNEENRTQKQQLDFTYREIETLNQIINQKNKVMEDLTFQKDNNDWKRNFQELNEKYHRAQEQLCFAQAELEASRATYRPSYLSVQEKK